MTASWILLAGFASAGFPDGSEAALLAAAAASGRPRECVFEGRRGSWRGPSVWEVARLPELTRYCDLVARAHAALHADPIAAQKAAELAEAAWPGRAAPLVILGRVALAMGHVDEAAAHFEKARAIDPRGLEDPATMHDFAEVLRRSGKLAEALGVYQALVPRVALLADANREVRVLLEAAHLSMSVEGERSARASTGSPSRDADADLTPAARLQEATAYLQEARQRPASQYSGDVLLSLALVLDRGSTKERADAALSEAVRQGARPQAGDLLYLTSREDERALRALALEKADPQGAAAAWEAFIAGPSPWVSTAKARLSAIRSVPAAARRGSR